MKHLFFFFLAVFTLNCCISNRTIERKGGVLATVFNEQDTVKKQLVANELVDSLVRVNQVPFKDQDSVTFLYNGAANSVSWHGDFNRWGSDTTINTQGSQIQNTTLWYKTLYLPRNARLDYKVVVNGKDWILDPLNTAVRYSGFGPNSELKMPEWQEDELFNTDNSSFKGSVINDTLTSIHLGYRVSIQIYKPYLIDNANIKNSLYLLDGQEFIEPHLGDLTKVLDVLIHENKIDPTLAVFISPLSPDKNHTNRRMDEYSMSEHYMKFVVEELVPHIDKGFQLLNDPNRRAIMGVSLGGLTSTYIAMRSNEFGRFAAFSPAYWYKQEIYNDLKPNHQRGFISTGTFYDALPHAQIMRDTLISKGLTIQYIEVNEGHSWGAWQNQEDDAILYLLR